MSLVCLELENELKRLARNLALLRQSADERIAYWAQWHDNERQLDLFDPSMGHDRERAGRLGSHFGHSVPGAAVDNKTD